MVAIFRGPLHGQTPEQIVEAIRDDTFDYSHTLVQADHDRDIARRLNNLFIQFTTPREPELSQRGTVFRFKLPIGNRGIGMELCHWKTRDDMNAYRIMSSVPYELEEDLGHTQPHAPENVNGEMEKVVRSLSAERQALLDEIERLKGEVAARDELLVGSAPKRNLTIRRKS